MKASRVAKLVLDIRNGFWIRPLVMLVAGVVLAYLSTHLDHDTIESTAASHLSPSGARALLSVAAGALVTTLAISLSMTMVTVQLASSQYTPRLLRRFLSDRFTQVVLGSFLATIAFQFVVLRSVRSPDEGTFFVPVLSLGVAAVATIASLALLVVFLHRTMRAMQASTIIAKIGREVVTTIEQLLAAELRPLASPLGGERQIVRADAPGYIALLDDDAIAAALARSSGAIRREANPGDFVLPGTALVAVYGGEPLSKAAIECVRDAFTLGSDRSRRARDAVAAAIVRPAPRRPVLTATGCRGRARWREPPVSTASASSGSP